MRIWSRNLLLYLVRLLFLLLMFIIFFLLFYFNEITLNIVIYMCLYIYIFFFIFFKTCYILNIYNDYFLIFEYILYTKVNDLLDPLWYKKLNSSIFYLIFYIFLYLVFFYFFFYKFYYNIDYIYVLNLLIFNFFLFESVLLRLYLNKFYGVNYDIYDKLIDSIYNDGINTDFSTNIDKELPKVGGSQKPKKNIIYMFNRAPLFIVYVLIILMLNDLYKEINIDFDNKIKVKE